MEPMKPWNPFGESIWGFIREQKIHPEKKTKHMEALDSLGKKNNIWVDGSYGYRSFFPLIFPGWWFVQTSGELTSWGNGSFFPLFTKVWDTSQQWLAGWDFWSINSMEALNLKTGESETNSSPLKLHRWKMMMAYFQGSGLVSGRVYLKLAGFAAGKKTPFF